VFGKCSVRISAGALAILVEVFRDFVQSLEANCSLVSWKQHVAMAFMSTESYPEISMDYTYCMHQDWNPSNMPGISIPWFEYFIWPCAICVVTVNIKKKTNVYN
jgi:hypothetical protein